MSSLEKLIALREKASISQTALASAIGKSQPYVWNVESGRRGLTARDTIDAWAEALGVHPDEVYHAIGAIPHDILEQLADADPETWDKVRAMLHK